MKNICKALVLGILVASFASAPVVRAEDTTKTGAGKKCGAVDTTNTSNDSTVQVNGNGTDQKTDTSSGSTNK